MSTITVPAYGLEERTFVFAAKARDFLKMIPRNIHNIAYYKQVIRSSSSIGANYIEANEALGKKDFSMHIRISLKEAKETKYWLRLLTTADEIQENVRKELINEVSELIKILGTILQKAGGKAMKRSA